MNAISKNRVQQYLAGEACLDELKSLIPEFLNKRQIEVKAMQEQVAKEDYEPVLNTCHQWKGFCEPYGFNGLALLGQTLSEACLKKEKDQSLSTLALINEYLAVKSQHLDMPT